VKNCYQLLSSIPVILFMLSGCGPVSEQATEQELAVVAPVQDVTQVINSIAEQSVAPSFYLYVTNEDSNNVTVINGDTNAVLATIPIGKRPRGLKVSPDGSKLYVAVSGAPKCPPTMEDDECEKLVTDLTADGIAEVDTATQQVIRVLPSGLDPEQFDVNWKSGFVYVANEMLILPAFWI